MSNNLPNTYGYNRTKLSQLKYTELEQLLIQVRNEHQLQRNEDGVRVDRNGNKSFYVYDQEGLKKIDNITWAVYYKNKRGDTV